MQILDAILEGGELNVRGELSHATIGAENGSKVRLGQCSALNVHGEEAEISVLGDVGFFRDLAKLDLNINGNVGHALLLLTKRQHYRNARFTDAVFVQTDDSLLLQAARGHEPKSAFFIHSNYLGNPQFFMALSENRHLAAFVDAGFVELYDAGKDIAAGQESFSSDPKSLL